MEKNNLPPKARLRRLNVRLSQPEWDKVHKLSANTTCRSVSEYARKVLSDKPVRVFYRNQSFDEFEERMTRLLPQLEAIGDNFDQTVKKFLHYDGIPEIRAALPTLQDCAQRFSVIAEEIRSHIEKLSDQCDPK
jgi:hypothetical protein